jgi:thiamine biosynthesis lipoprotein
MLDLLFPTDEPETPPGEFTLIRVSRRAMATTFEIAIPAGTHPDPYAAASSALDLIDELEDQMTVYREQSEVSRLNAKAAEAPVVVEAQLFELFTRCAAWVVETEGAFDIATGSLIKAWGFFKREGCVPGPRDRAAAMACTGFKHVILNPDAQTVKYRRTGLEINLGAVGKGYALDRAARLLRDEWGVASALLHAGGSSVYAIGHPPLDSRGWPIRLRHPSKPEESLGTVYLRHCGLGTSAATFQFFEYKGEKLGHLLDPRIGWPASGVDGVSVMASTAAEADAMSTAAFVLGVPGTAKLMRLKPALGAVVLTALASGGRESPGCLNYRGTHVPRSPQEQHRGTHVPRSPQEQHRGTHVPRSPELAIFNLGSDSYSPARTD